jgi:hypothetical protein
LIFKNNQSFCLRISKLELKIFLFLNIFFLIIKFFNLINNKVLYLFVRFKTVFYRGIFIIDYTKSFKCVSSLILIFTRYWILILVQIRFFFYFSQYFLTLFLRYLRLKFLSFSWWFLSYIHEVWCLWLKIFTVF